MTTTNTKLKKEFVLELEPIIAKAKVAIAEHNEREALQIAEMLLALTLKYIDKLEPADLVAALIDTQALAIAKGMIEIFGRDSN
jgi:hypothetical protein